MIIVTGASGMLGHAFAKKARAQGEEITGIDKRHFANREVVLMDASSAEMREILNNSAVEGVVHFAAVSRVVDAQLDPDYCVKNNVQTLASMLHTCVSKKEKPWFCFASSREVYGQAAKFPAPESTPLRPVNVYGHSKLAGEAMCLAARDAGMRTLNVRLSSVYGCPHDHVTRVIPAFVRAALQGETLRLEGRDHTFDFTYLDDVVDGLWRACEYLRSGAPLLPAVHLVSGAGTTLHTLASMVVEKTGRGRVQEFPSRSYDVSHFVGDPSLAEATLGWKLHTTLDAGLDRFIAEMRQVLAA